MHQGPKPTHNDLRRAPLLRPLTDAQLTRIAARAVRLRLDDGAPLFEQGDRAERFHLVLRGQVKLYRLSPDGVEKVIEIVTPGSTFAEALMFLNRPQYPVGATALGEVELVSIDAADFKRMLGGSVETCFLIMGDMSRRLRALITEIDELSLSSAMARVAAYLVRRCDADGADFDLGVPKQVLASRLTVKPETLSRILRSLSDRGMVRVAGRRIRVERRDDLAAVAESQANW